MNGIRRWDTLSLHVDEVPLEDKERPYSFFVSVAGAFLHESTSTGAFVVLRKWAHACIPLQLSLIHI